MVANAYSRRPVHATVVRPAGPFGSVASFASRFALALLVATVAARWLGLITLDEIVAPLGLAAIAAGVGLLATLLALADAWARGVRGGWRAMRAFALVVIAAVPLAVFAQRGLAREPVLDLTTDPLSPPSLAGVIADPDVPVSAAEGLSTRRYEATIERVGPVVAAAIEDTGWPIDASPFRQEAVAAPAPELPVAEEVVAPVPRMRPLTDAEQAVRNAVAQAELEALADARREEEAILVAGGRVVSPVLRIATEVTIRLRDDGDSTAVDVRVRATEGRHDFGETERRARDFLAALDAASARSGVR